MTILFRTLLGLLCLCVCYAQLFCTSALAAEKQKKVFILHSYEIDHVCGYPQHRGTLHALGESGFVVGKNITLDVYAMDTKRYNNTPKLIAEQAQIALKRIAEFAPDVVITLDDNAFRTVGLALAKTNTPVVFSGLNGSPESYNTPTRWLESRHAPGHNITGVIEKLHVLSALRVQKQIIPKLQRIKIISDLSPTGKAILKQVTEELSSVSHPFSWDVEIAKNWEEYQAITRRACTNPTIDTLYPAALLLKDANGTSHTAPSIIGWTTSICPKPSIPINFAFVKLGIMGGAGVDFEAMGYQAGELAAQILAGKSAGSLPIQEAERYALVFNLARAKKLGITIPEEILLAADEVYEN